MIVITTCNSRQWEARGLATWLPSFSKIFPPQNLIVYHENSFDSVPIAADKMLPTASYFDLFEADSELKTIVSRPEYEEIKKTRSRYQKHRKYHCFNAQFWFRKIAAIRQAVKLGSNFCWTDIDVVAKSRFLNRVEGLSAVNDICYIDRSGNPRKVVTDTGFIIFRKSPAVVEFIEAWYDVYRSGKVFSMPYWADHYMFDETVKAFANLRFYKLPDARTRMSMVYHRRGHKEMARIRLPDVHV